MSLRHSTTNSGAATRARLGDNPASQPNGASRPMANNPDSARHSRCQTSSGCRSSVAAIPPELSPNSVKYCAKCTSAPPRNQGRITRIIAATYTTDSPATARPASRMASLPGSPCDARASAAEG